MRFWLEGKWQSENWTWPFAFKEHLNPSRFHSMGLC